jgi:hypothetical protein
MSNRVRRLQRPVDTIVLSIRGDSFALIARVSFISNVLEADVKTNGSQPKEPHHGGTGNHTAWRDSSHRGRA